MYDVYYTWYIPFIHVVHFFLIEWKKYSSRSKRQEKTAIAAEGLAIEASWRNLDDESGGLWNLEDFSHPDNFVYYDNWSGLITCDI